MDEQRTYEFACHITTQLDEAQVPAIWEESQKLISEHGGNILAAQQPEKRRLSYAIQHQRQAFFGWVQFTLSDPAGLQALQEWTHMRPEVLRSVILKLEPESDKRAAQQQEHLARKAARQAKEVTSPKKVAPEKKAESSGELEQQLEDIIGNL